MIVNASCIQDVFDAVKHDKHKSEDKTVIIFVANGDVDSVCTHMQLETLLGKTDTPTLTIPVETYEDIKRHAQDQGLHEAEDLKTVFLINCGATEDIRLVCDFSDNVRTIIIDSHRPIWHGYKDQADSNTIVVLDEDDPTPLHAIPDYTEDDKRMADGEDSDDEESDDDEGSGSEDEGEEDEEGGSQRGPGEPGTSKRSSSQGGRPSKRRKVSPEELMRHRNEVDEYYLTRAGYGKPSALIIFQLAYTQTQDDNWQCWLAILGLTDQWIHQRCDIKMYEKWRGQMAQHVGHQAAGAGQDAADGQTNNQARHRLTISRCNELNIPLLRHWSLREALLYQTHVATRMCTWRDSGQKQVDLLLAASNVDNQQSQAKYTSMNPFVVEKLHQKFRDKADKFKLSVAELSYDGFELQYKNDVRVSAPDHVLAISAMLGRPRVGAHENALDVFKEAADCLLLDREHGIKALKAGIERAKLLAAKVVDEGGLLVTRKQVVGSRSLPCWFLDLSDLSFQSARDFHHPSTLLKLAVFIRDAWSQRGQVINAKERARMTPLPPQPIVLVGPANESDQCYVVAARAKQQAGVMQNNPLSIPFQEAMQDNQDYVTATFDTTVFQLRRDQVFSFLERLKGIIESYKSDAAAAAASRRGAGGDGAGAGGPGREQGLQPPAAAAGVVAHEMAGPALAVGIEAGA